MHITKVADCLSEKEINARDMSPKLLLLSAASDSIMKRQRKRKKGHDTCVMPPLIQDKGLQPIRN